MKKQIFNIPIGCTITIEEYHGNLVTTIESLNGESLPSNMTTYENEINKRINPDVRFKDGDIVYLKDEICEVILIFKEDRGTSLNPYLCHCAYKINGQKLSENLLVRNSFDVIRIATKLEQDIIFYALAKVGKFWNAEKKCIEELKPKRWRAEKYYYYWFINTDFKPSCNTETGCFVDDRRYKADNYFQTEQQAKDFAERIKQLLR